MTRGRVGWLGLARTGLPPAILCQLSWRTKRSMNAAIAFQEGVRGLATRNGNKASMSSTVAEENGDTKRMEENGDRSIYFQKR